MVLEQPHDVGEFRCKLASALRRTAMVKLWCWYLIGVASVAVTGCTSILSPISGVPAHRLPAEFHAQPKNDLVPISISRLRRDPPQAYYVDADDTLGIYIEGILGSSEESPPVHFPENDSDLPPSIGFPIPVREDGSLALPLVNPIMVRGLTLVQIEDAIRKAYTVDREILQAGKDRIIVTLMRKRTYRVLVMRQDERSGASRTQSGTVEHANKSTNSNVVELPAYKNDVLNALAETGGLPGLDVKNEVQILKASRMQPEVRDQFIRNFYAQPLSENCVCRPPLPDDPAIIKIPLRLPPGQTADISQKDIILENGDIVYIESRDTEVFYTGGLLGGGEYQLPRDYDLDVLGALAIVGTGVASSGGQAGAGQQVGGGGGYGGGGSGLTGIPPGQLFILRKTPCKGQITIAVDLNRAITNPGARPLIQAGDILILRYKPQEELLNFGIISFFTFGIAELIRD